MTNKVDAILKAAEGLPEHEDAKDNMILGRPYSVVKWRRSDREPIWLFDWHTAEPEQNLTRYEVMGYDCDIQFETLEAAINKVKEFLNEHG